MKETAQAYERLQIDSEFQRIMSALFLVGVVMGANGKPENAQEAAQSMPDKVMTGLRKLYPEIDERDHRLTTEIARIIFETNIGPLMVGTLAADAIH